MNIISALTGFPPIIARGRGPLPPTRCAVRPSGLLRRARKLDTLAPDLRAQAGLAWPAGLWRGAAAAPPVHQGAENTVGHVNDEQDQEEAVDHLVEGERGAAEQALERLRALDDDPQALGQNLREDRPDGRSEQHPHAARD